MKDNEKQRKLPKGIQKRRELYEARPMINGRRYFIQGRTIGETQKAVVELRYKLAHGLYIPKTDLLLNDWMKIWLEQYKAGVVKDGTLETYQIICHSLIEPYFTRNKLQAVRADHIQAFFNDLLRRDYSRSTIELSRAVLSGALKQAYRNGMIEKNPMDQAQIPRKANAVNEGCTKVLTKEQQQVFMEAARGSYLCNLFGLLIRTGLRIGEALALTYKDIDKRKGVIHIRRTLKEGHGGFYVNSPKSKTSARDIPLTEDIISILDAQKTYLSGKVTRIDGYIFSTLEGQAIHRNRVQTEIDRLIRQINEAEREKAKKEGREPVAFPRFTPHTFRHTFATRAIEAGMKPQTLKAILGHSSLAMTMDLYSHVLEDTKAEEMKKIAGVFL